MLIYLSDKIFEFDKVSFSKNELIECIDNVLKAHIEGKHIVAIPYSVAEKILQLEGIGENFKRKLKIVSSKFSTLGGLKRALSFYAKVVAPSCCGNHYISLEHDGDMAIANIPICLFGDTEIIQKPIMYTENQEDAVLYEHLLRGFIAKHNKELAGIKLAISKKGCGGSAIFREFMESLNSKTVSVTIVDSDRDSRASNVGDTAKQFRNVPEITVSNSLNFFHLLPVREIENLLPINLIKNSLPNSSCKEHKECCDILELWESIFIDDWRFYIDLKNGLGTARLLSLLTEKQTADCWTSYYEAFTNKISVCSDCKQSLDSKADNVCDCMIFSGFGDALLSSVNSHLQKLTSHKIAEYFSTYFSIGEVLTLCRKLTSIHCCLDKARI